VYSYHNFTQITQQTKVWVALVMLNVSCQSNSTCQARRVECVEPCCSTSSTQPKCMGSTRRTCRVVMCWDVTSQVEFELMRVCKLVCVSLLFVLSPCERSRSVASLLFGFKRHSRRSRENFIERVVFDATPHFWILYLTLCVVSFRASCGGFAKLCTLTCACWRGSYH